MKTSTRSRRIRGDSEVKGSTAGTGRTGRSVLVQHIPIAAPFPLVVATLPDAACRSHTSSIRLLADIDKKTRQQTRSRLETHGALP